MSEPVNLNKARKAQAKAQKAKDAAENRVRFGRTKADRELASARETKARRDLEGLKRED